MGQLGVVIDAQVVSEQSNLQQANTRKRSYYANNPDIDSEITRSTGATTIKHIPATLNWKGVWCPTSAAELLSLGTINKRDLAIISTRVLIGGRHGFRVFNNTTTTRRGVG